MADYDRESVGRVLHKAGILNGEHGLVDLLEKDEFWQDRPYKSRLYFGDAGDEYLHRDVLAAAARLLSRLNNDDALRESLIKPNTATGIKEVAHSLILVTGCKLHELWIQFCGGCYDGPFTMVSKNHVHGLNLEKDGGWLHVETLLRINGVEVD